MKSVKHTIAKTILVIMAICIILTGCSGSGSNSSSRAVAASASDATRKDLTLCVAVELDTFDPVASAALATTCITAQVFTRLFNVNQEQQPIQELAKTVKQLSDTETLITIQDNALFEDGTKITIDDVVYCLNRAAKSAVLSTLMKAVASIEKVDENSLKITTNGPLPSLSLALSHTACSILPKSYVEKAVASGDWSKPIASGRYKLKSREIGNKLTIVKNDKFFDPVTSAQNNSLTFKLVPEASSRTIMVETGEADLSMAFATADYERVKKNPNLALYEHTSAIVNYLGYDVTIAPFNNKLVRQAMNYAIDRESLIKVAADGHGAPWYSVLPPTCMGALENPGNYKYDVKKAKELLAQAGYPNGFKMTLCVFSDEAKRIGEAVQIFLADAGITVEIQSLESSVSKDMTAAHKVPARIAKWGAYSDPDLVLPRTLGKGGIGGANVTFYYTDELEDLYVKARSTFDNPTRIKYYQDAQKIIMEDAPWCPLYIGVSFGLARKGLQNVIVDPEQVVEMYKLHY